MDFGLHTVHQVVPFVIPKHPILPIIPTLNPSINSYCLLQEIQHFTLTKLKIHQRLSTSH